jgi:peptidoglycan hydrolase-like protein with peptidoglycan-binding domain
VSTLKEHRTVVIVAAAVIVAAVVAGVLLNGHGGKSSSTSETVTTSPGSTTATDPAVADLQKVMTRLGYYTGPIDGVYGPATTAAVKQMQTALGVTADGVYGPTTAVALKGKGKDVVVQVQTELARYGYYTGPIDGHYGPDTKAAVKKLQTDLGLTADGLVGAETVAAFNKAVADGTLKPTTTTTTAPATTKAATTTTTTAAATTTAATTSTP